VIKKERIIAPGVSPTAPGGVYSSGIRVGNLVFLSGFGPFDSERKLIGPGDPAAQTEQTLHNMRLMLESVGASFDNVVRWTTYLLDMRHLSAVNEVKRKYFSEPYPASASVGVASLAIPGMLLEIDAIAVLDE
jgi:2-iminobutanoate/2-iminopropanoate deaminase